MSAVPRAAGRRDRGRAIVVLLVALLSAGVAVAQADQGAPPPGSAPPGAATTPAGATTTTSTTPAGPPPATTPAEQPPATVPGPTTAAPSATTPAASSVPSAGTATTLASSATASSATQAASHTAHAARASHARPVAHAAGAGSVTIKDFSFGPSAVTVHAGETVTWTNQGPSSHTATGSGFDTGILGKGQSASHTFSTAGTFSYHCTIHPFMKGTVTVLASTSAASGGSGTASGTGTSGGTGTTAPSTTATGASLPRTGTDTAGLAILGLALALTGILLRRRTRSH